MARNAGQASGSQNAESSHQAGKRMGNKRQRTSSSSEDEMERNFIRDLAWGDKNRWDSSQMRWNTIHGDDWIRCEKLGSGTYGAVYLGMRCHDRKLFAVKSINVTYPIPAISREFKRLHAQLTEIKMMRLLKSKYIVRCLGCGRSNGNNGVNGHETLDVFLEYAIRGSLSHVINSRNKLLEEDPYLRQYTYDILKALQHMHKKRVVHGDIKAGNLLLGDDCVKLADWGGAGRVEGTSLRSILSGTIGFKSPEVQSKREQSYPSDIFSLGCTIIQMATGLAPEKIVTKVTGVDRYLNPIQVHEERYEIPDTLSEQCKDFLKLCLCKDPANRWTATELLLHPFVFLRDKSNPLPYSQQVPQSVQSALLLPRARRHQDVSDDVNDISQRAYAHLSGSSTNIFTNNLFGWALNRMGCTTAVALAPAQAPSVPRRIANPLSPLRPDFVPAQNTNLDENLLNAINPTSPPRRHPNSPPRPPHPALAVLPSSGGLLAPPHPALAVLPSSGGLLAPPHPALGVLPSSGGLLAPTEPHPALAVLPDSESLLPHAVLDVLPKTEDLYQLSPRSPDTAQDWLDLMNIHMNDMMGLNAEILAEERNSSTEPDPYA